MALPVHRIWVMSCRFLPAHPRGPSRWLLLPPSTQLKPGAFRAAPCDPFPAITPHRSKAHPTALAVASARPQEFPLLCLLHHLSALQAARYPPRASGRTRSPPLAQISAPLLLDTHHPTSAQPLTSAAPLLLRAAAPLCCECRPAPARRLQSHSPQSFADRYHCGKNITICNKNSRMMSHTYSAGLCLAV